MIQSKQEGSGEEEKKANNFDANFRRPEMNSCVINWI